MPIKRPRRIFRSSFPPSLGLSGLGGGAGHAAGRATAVLVAVALGGGVAVLALHATTLFGRAPRPPDRLEAPAALVAVVDGATLRMRDTVVRLAGVAVPERGEACRGSDGGGVDCGVAAANALAGLVRDRAVDCRLDGRDAMGRALALCAAGGADLNRALVQAGWARADGAVAALQPLQDQARARGLGAWAGGAWPGGI